MTPIKFRLNLTYGLGDVVGRISRWPQWRPSWILEPESLCHCVDSHQVLAQSHLQFGRFFFEEFQDGHHGGHLGYRNGTILAILNL